MKKLLKFIGIVLAGILGLLLLLIIVLKLIPDDQYKSWITSAVESSTGRTFSMESLQLNFGTSLRIGADNVQLANADWAEEPEMFSVNHLDAELRLLPLFSGRAEVTAHIDTADFISQSNEDGIANWDMSAGQVPEETPEQEVTDDQSGSGLPIRPIIRELRIDDLTLSKIDKTPSKSETVVLKHLLIETPEIETTLTLEADAGGVPVSISGNLGDIDSALDQISTPLSIGGKLGDSELKISGEWGPVLPVSNLDLNLLFEIQVPSTASLAAIAGIEMEDIGEIEFSARTRASKGVFSIEDIVTKLDGKSTSSSAAGAITNLNSMTGIDIGIKLDTQALGRLVHAFKIELPVPLPPEVQLSAQIQGGKSGLAINDIKVEVRDEGVDILLSGAIDDILKSRQVKGEFSATADSLSRFSEYAKIQLPALGAIALSGNIQSKGKAIALQGVVLDLTADNLSVDVSGDVEDVLTVNGINAKVDADIKSLTQQNISELTTLLKSFEVELPVKMLPQSIKLSTGVQGNLEQLGLTDIKAEVTDKGIKISLLGTVENVMVPSGVTANVTLNSDSVASFSKYAGIELPALGAITLSGKVQSEGKAIALEGVDIGLTADNLNVEVSGGIQDVLTVNGIKAQIDADIKSLTQQNISELTALLKSFEVELPVEMLPQSVKLSTGVQGNLEQLGLTDITAEVKDKGINVSLLGTVENVLAPSGVTANVTLNSDSVASFSKYAGTELPDLGPLDATASVVSSGETYSLKSMKANLKSDILQAKVTASIADLLAVSGINAKITAETATLASLSDLAQTELPDTDPVKVDATLKGKNIEQARLDVTAQSGDAQVVVNSLISQLKAATDLKIDVSVKAKTLGDFDKFAQKELPDQGPLDLSATLNIDSGTYTLNALKFKLADQSATGDMTLKLPADNDENGITLLHGNLDIPYLDLSPYTKSAELEVKEETQELDSTVSSEVAPTELADETVKSIEGSLNSDEPVAESDRLLSSEPLVVDFLEDYDVDITVNGDRIKLGQADLNNLQLKVTLKDSLLNIGPISGSGSTGGTINATVKLDGRSNNPALNADITIADLAMPNLGGHFDFNLDVTGQGQSPAALMASLNGQIVMVAQDGVIPSSFVSSFGSGWMSSSGGKDTTNLECLILNANIVDGVANFKNKLAAQLTEVTWRGGGIIDFNTERLNIDITPKPRKGIPVSIGGGLAGLVRLGGTLKNPQVVPDYSDAAFKYAKYSAYVATGGLSLLAEIINNKIQSNKDVCEQILDGTVFAAADKAEKKNLPK